MDGLAKLALSLGSKAVALITLITSCVVIAAGLFWQQEQASQQYLNVQNEHQQQTAKILQEFTLSRSNDLHAQMQAIASSPQIIASLSNNDSSLIELQQQDVHSYFPNAKKVCLISAEVDDVTSYGCMPITFVILNSLRQAKKNGSAQIGLIKQRDKEAYVLLAQKIQNKSGEIVGVLVVTLDANVVPTFLYDSAEFKGYLELQQGIKKVTTLVNQGDVKQKQGAAPFVQKIPNTYWQLAYWPMKQPKLPNSTMMLITILVAVLILMWLLREGFKAFLLKRDVSTIRLQLADLKAGTLKPKYAVSLSPLKSIVTDILTLGRENYYNTAKKGATAESVGKKIDEIENAPLQSDMLQETVQIDPVIFRAYDIRGIVGENLDEEVVKIVGQAVGSEANEQGITRLVVGRDARLSSASLSTALIEGIIESGCDVLDIGEVPTPVMHFACEQFNTHSGVMVTGSHNPAEYNGLKIVLAGQSIAQEALQKIYQRIQQEDLRTGTGARSEINVVNDYISRIAGDVRLARPIKVVIDCGNGVAGAVAPALFKAIGCDVVELFCDVDGHFPNHHPNPSQPENLQDLTNAVKQHDAELGLAFDGDGDRLGVVDAKGNPIWPDRLLILFAQDILSRVPGSIVIYDVKCTSLLGEEIANAGGEALMCESGHSLIRNKMQETDAMLAGELSGHIFIKERWYGFDDAMYAAGRLLELISSDLMQRNATGVFNSLPSRVNTPELLVEMEEGESIAFIRKLAGEGHFDGAELITLDGIRAEYINGWGLVRSSNTTPGLTLRFEANSLEELQEIQQRFKEQMLQIKPTLKLNF